MADPRCLPIVRTYLDHPDWRIKLHAIAGIGRMGSWEDVDGLIQALTDREYWVRYRAGQALARLPMVDIDTLMEIREGQEDPFARDILHQVIAEEVGT